MEDRVDIHQEVDFKGSPHQIYEALVDSKRHAEFTGGGPTDVSREAGGTFSCFGGVVGGRNVELVPDKRIVQAWRVSDWPQGIYSMVRFDLQPRGADTHLVMDHSGVPEDQQEHIASGWYARYWEPLAKYLASQD
jgi:activator of HSP90 ATPase